VNYAGQGGFLTTRLQAFVQWARKFSLFQYPFVTACCGMEYMSVAGPFYDLDRFGAALPRFSPRQADVLIVVGTVNHKMAPILRKVYEQMAEPKWVISFGVCATSGGFYHNYAAVQGIDLIIPVDVYIPGCPPRPEMVLDGIMKLQAKIQQQGRDMRLLEETVPSPYARTWMPGVEEPVAVTDSPSDRDVSEA